MSSESGQGGLSNAATSITISSRVWKLGDKISGVLENVVTKKEMAKSFDGRCPTTTVEGVLSGIWANTEIFVQRQCDSGQIVLEHSRSHKSLKIFIWRRVQKEGGNREKNRFSFKRRCSGCGPCGATTSRPSPTCDSSFWWRTALWFSTGRVSGKILPNFTK